MRFISFIVLLCAALAARADDLPGTIVLQAKDASVEGGGSAHYEIETHHDNIGYWNSTNSIVRWSVEVKGKKTLRVVVVVACPDNEAGSDIEVRIGNQRATGIVPATGDYQKYADLDLGPVIMRKPGKYDVSVQCTRLAHGHVGNLRAVKLVPDG